MRKTTAVDPVAELSVPENVLFDVPLRDLSCGPFHAAAASEFDGRLYTWGRGNLGLLGHGDTDTYEKPTKVAALANKTIRKVSCGLYHTAALTDQKELWSWGWCFEDNQGMRESFSMQPKQLLSNIQIRSVTCGHFMSAAISGDGVLYTWGRGTSGNLGHGDFQDVPTPRYVTSLSTKNTLQVASGRNFTLALTDEGVVYSFGEAKNGQLGNGKAPPPSTDAPVGIPVVISSLVGMGVTSIQCGQHHSVAIASSGELFTWGSGYYSRLGHPAMEDAWTPTQVAALKGISVKSASCGTYHTLAVTEKQGVWAWGGYGTKFVAPHKLADAFAGSMVAVAGDRAFIYKGPLFVDDEEEAMILDAANKTKDVRVLPGQTTFDNADASLMAALESLPQELLGDIPPGADLAEIEAQQAQLMDQLNRAFEQKNNLTDELNAINEELQAALMMEEQLGEQVQAQIASLGANMALGPYANIPPEQIVFPSKGVSFVNEPSYALLNATEKYEMKLLGFRMQYATTKPGMYFEPPLVMAQREDEEAEAAKAAAADAALQQ